NSRNNAGNDAGSGDSLGSNGKPERDVPTKHRNKPPLSHGLRSRALREGRIKPFRGNHRKQIAINRWRDQLIRDLGGPDMVTGAQAQTIAMIAQLRSRLDHADLWMSKQPTLIDPTTNAMYPVVGQWRLLVESMTKLL